MTRTLRTVVLWCCLVLPAVLHTALTSISSVDNCYASSSDNVTCSVNYTSNLTLHCPNNHSVGSWWRTGQEGQPQSICSHPVCDVNPDRQLHNEDSGWYFCRVPVNSTYYNDYYIDLSVLAPPSISCKLCICNEQAHHCTQPLVSKEVDEDVTLTLQFSGVGPFSVHWQHNTRPLHCSNTLTHDNCTLKTYSNSTEVLTVPAPHSNLTKDSGLYTAIISNAYGYNMTSWSVDITCQFVDPPTYAGNSTVNMTEGDSGNVTLKALGSQQNNLWLCYTTDLHTTMWNISLNDSCHMCLNEWSGPCGKLPNRPSWSITRNQEKACHIKTQEQYVYLLEMIVHVTSVSDKDQGKFILTWSSDDKDQGPEKHADITETLLFINEKENPDKASVNYSRYVYVGSAGGCALLVMLVAGGVVIFVVKNRKQKIPVRRQAVRPIADVSSSDGDDEERLFNPSRNYGSISDANTLSDPGTAIESDATLGSRNDSVVQI